MASGVESADGNDGLWLVGEYLGVKRETGRQRDPADASKGFWPDRYKVGVRVGSDVLDVEFGSPDSAEVALAAFNAGGYQRGDTIRLAVRARAAKGYVFWMGQGEQGASGDYE
jgi:hypothetical protein